MEKTYQIPRSNLRSIPHIPPTTQKSKPRYSNKTQVFHPHTKNKQTHKQISHTNAPITRTPHNNTPVTNNMHRITHDQKSTSNIVKQIFTIYFTHIEKTPHRPHSRKTSRTVYRRTHKQNQLQFLSKTKEQQKTIHTNQA